MGAAAGGHGRAEVDLPQRRVRVGVVGVKGVDAVVHGRHIDHVCCFAVDIDARHIQGLGEDLAVDVPTEQVTELVHIHVGRVENGFIGVGRRTVGVILTGGNSRITGLRQ